MQKAKPAPSQAGRGFRAMAARKREAAKETTGRKKTAGIAPGGVSAVCGLPVGLPMTFDQGFLRKIFSTTLGFPSS
jgi:hypothetical protein